MLNVNLNTGIGDLIISRSQLFQVDGPIRINISDWTSNWYRGPHHSSFVRQLVKLLFPADKFTILYNMRRIRCAWYELLDRGIAPKPRIEIINSLIDRSIKLPTKHYIVLNTKVRYCDKSRFMNIRDLLCSILNMSNYPIILLGEREVSKVREYKNQSIYSIYNDVKPFLKNVIDLTVSNLYKPDIKALRSDCYIMSEAKLVINFGNGGNLHISESVTSNTCSFYDGDLLFAIEPRLLTGVKEMHIGQPHKFEPISQINLLKEIIGQI